MDISSAHHLIGFGGSEGLMEFWDPRSRSKVTSIFSTLPSHMINDINENLDVTSLKFDQSGLQMAVGLAGGKVLLYDLRGNQPYLVKDHQYNLPIKRMQWLYTPHSDGPKLATADSKILKIWDVPNGKHFTSLEPTYDINDFVHFPDSGMLMVANEGPEMHTFYIPQLGPAPKWCTFLENITEELEEQAHTTIYDDYKFVTRSELSKLGLEHLLGTRVLRGYMHGFLMDIRLYEQARLIANPFEIEEYKTRRIADKLASERKSRVEGVKKKAKVNQHLLDKALEQKMGRTSAKNKKTTVAEDDRFAKLFEDADFEVDTQSREFKLLNPNQKEGDVQTTQARDDDEESELEGKGSDEDSSEDELETSYVPKPKRIYNNNRGGDRGSDRAGNSRGGDRGGNSRGGNSRGGKPQFGKGSKPQFKKQFKGKRH
jgi:ribosome biogenesis protein ENP2